MDTPQARIYLDNAATSWPKPPTVVEAITNFYGRHGSAASRGSGNDTIASDQGIARVRRQVATLVNADNADQVVFTFNGTDSLNTAIRGVVRPGMHVITSVLEHNSVLRPLHYLQQQGQISLTTIGINDDGRIDIAALEDAVVNDTGLICVSHVSNVLGTTQPIQAIGAIEKPTDCLLLVDAAQSIGHLPIDVSAMNCDLLAASGHKGLLGPLGTGLLFVGDRVSERIEPLRLGGTGSNSESLDQPPHLPQRLESGNPNVAGILALGAGLDHVQSLGVEHIGNRLLRLRNQAVAGLQSVPDVQIYATDPAGQSSGALSFNVRGMEPAEVASILEAEFAIQTRAGLHCSPLAHRALGTDKIGGTVRISPGVFSTTEEIDALVTAVGEIATA